MGGIGTGVESGWIKLYNRRRHLESMIEFIEGVSFICCLVPWIVTVRTGVDSPRYPPSPPPLMKPPFYTSTSWVSLEYIYDVDKDTIRNQA